MRRLQPHLHRRVAGFGNLSWRSIGPAVAGGRVAAVAGTPQDDQLYYLGTAGGGVWKSEQRRRDVGAGLRQAAGRRRSARSRSIRRNENVVWAGTGESNPRNDVSYGDGLYKSTDGGKTWTQRRARGMRHISRIAVDPRESAARRRRRARRLFNDSPDRGVYVTFDGGTNVDARRSTSARAAAPATLRWTRSNPNVVYAGMWQFRRQPWTFTSGGPDDGLYKSTDGGKTWKKLDRQRLAGRHHRDGSGLAIAPSDANRVYALIEAQRRHSLALRRRRRDVDDDVERHARRSAAVLLHAHRRRSAAIANHVYAVSEMLAESKDGGKKFNEIAKDVHVDYHAIWIAPNDPKRIIVGEDGGYALTTDGGRTGRSRAISRSASSITSGFEREPVLRLRRLAR